MSFYIVSYLGIIISASSLKVFLSLQEDSFSYFFPPGILKLEFRPYLIPTCSTVCLASSILKHAARLEVTWSPSLS